MQETSRTNRKKVTLPDLMKKMADDIPITMITCYDYAMAHLVEQAEVDMVLVGDSLGMTMLGYDGTLPVTMDDMMRHTQAVRRGSPTSWLIGDMPYMSYQPSDEAAVRNAGRFMAQAACDGIKLEGGPEGAPSGMAILLGLVPDQACGLITQRAKIPIISLGSGPHAHGQLLIFHDMFGLYPKFTPKIAKVYGNAGEVILKGLQPYD